MPILRLTMSPGLMTKRRARGQAAVETAITMPLVLFLILGTMQLFSMMHGRVMTQYAAYRATRAGSVNHGNCEAMTHAAILALLPSIGTFIRPGGGGAAAQMADMFDRHKSNRYNDVVQTGGAPVTYTGAIVWIVRDLSDDRGMKGVSANEEERFDQGMVDNELQLTRLETRLIFWYPMRIPFANWVMSKMLLAHMGLQSYIATNPLMTPQTANWDAAKGGSTLETSILDELLARHNAGEYVFPIEGTYSMRMMTPARPGNFNHPTSGKNCSPTPFSL